MQKNCTSRTNLPRAERARKQKEVKRMVAVCIAVVWIGMLVCIAGMKRTAKEQLRWYVWYALAVSVAATAEMLLIAGSAK